MHGTRIILIDSDDHLREVLANRLRAQGYLVEVTADPITGANIALAEPPQAVVADLWMPDISGIQLCRLLQAEPATTDVPVILRATSDEPRNRFWAERAGAAGYVPKGRMGDLLRALRKAVIAPQSDGFFTHFSNSHRDIRNRITAHLDEALFESVLAAEVRSLGTCGSFESLFDLFSQFVCQVSVYRWLGLYMRSPQHLGVHTNPSRTESTHQEALLALAAPPRSQMVLIEDEDAAPAEGGPMTLVEPIMLGREEIGRIALAPLREDFDNKDLQLVRLMARELSGPLRIVSLIEETRRLAAIDPLTGLSNRRSFSEEFAGVLRAHTVSGQPLAALLLDIDHFKQVNDRLGHAAGDKVIAAMGDLLRSFCPDSALLARWGGEEFVVVLPATGHAEALSFGESLRQAIAGQDLEIEGAALPVTASIGLSYLRQGDSLDSLLDRADRAMYLSKVAGRNRVQGEEALADHAGEIPAAPARARKATA